MERYPRYMESLFCGKVESHVCGEVERNVCASSQCKSVACVENMFLLTLNVRVKHIWWSVRDLYHVSMVYHSLGPHNLTKLKTNLSSKNLWVCQDIAYGSSRTFIP